MLRKAPAVAGVALVLVLAAFSAVALAQTTITLQSATLLDSRHIQVNATATCDAGRFRTRRGDEMCAQIARGCTSD